MKTEKTDRRVKLTKQLIKESLVELMQEQPISRISVKMLCEAADINRSTFYAHYTDTYDLLRQIQCDVISEISEYISQSAFSEQSQLTVQAMSHILEYAKENSKLLKVLLSENGDFNFQKDIMLLAQQKTINELKTMENLDKRISEYLQLFTITGALSVMEKWLKDGMQESTQEMAQMCSTLLYNGLSGYFIP
ncbi:MAG: TetR/AcrR family transcriptional regulator C-terminal domain-containing protein [Eubacteriales bacterium]